MVKLLGKNAFTLVELLIVMMILGILMGLGWRGLAVLKREYMLQTQAENLQEALREARNRALTSAMESGSGGAGVIQWVYGFVVRFDDEGYDTYKMVEGMGIDELSDETLQTYWESDNWQNGGEIVDQNTGFVQMDVDNNCGQIGFSSVNGRMIVSDGGDACEITLTVSGSDRILELDSVTGDILIR